MLRSIVLTAISSCLVLVLQCAAFGQVTLEGEFVVNTYTTNDQLPGNVSIALDGSFVAAWQSNTQDGSGNGVYVQRFDSSGAPAGTEFRVNTFTVSEQWDVDVSSAIDGKFVVVWHSRLQDDATDGGVYARRYDSAGNPLSPEFRVNTYTTGLQFIPRVSHALDGSFVVVWDSEGQDGSGYGVFGQRYDSAGSPAGTEFRVNTYTTGSQSGATVASAPDGRFVVGWTSPQDPGGSNAAVGQRYDASGNPAGTEFVINTYTTNTQGVSDIAMNGDGSFTVTMNDFGGHDGDGVGVFVRRYNAAGSPIGTEFQVNTYTTYDQNRSAIAAKGDGSFVVVWNSGLGLFGTQDGDGLGVFGQRFDTSGNPVGAEFQLNEYTTGLQEAPEVDVDVAGNFIATWRSAGQDGSGTAMIAQRVIVGLCGPTPEPDGSCKLADPGLGAGKSSLLIKNYPGIATKDSLKWKWGKGVSTVIADFLDPESLNTSVSLCVYDSSANPQPLMNRQIQTGPSFWGATNSGYKFKNSSGLPNGMTAVTLKAGGAGKAQVSVKGKSYLDPPDTAALTGNVVLQLIIDDGVNPRKCFKTSFPGTGGTIKTQDSTQFKATGP